MIPETHKDILKNYGIAHVATVGPRGAPHSTPVWYGWDGEHLILSTVNSTQKYGNIERDARVAVSILDPDNTGATSARTAIRGTSGAMPGW